MPPLSPESLLFMVLIENQGTLLNRAIPPNLLHNFSIKIAFRISFFYLKELLPLKPSFTRSFFNMESHPWLHTHAAHGRYSDTPHFRITDIHDQKTLLFDHKPKLLY